MTILPINCRNDSSLGLALRGRNMNLEKIVLLSIFVVEKRSFDYAESSDSENIARLQIVTCRLTDLCKYLSFSGYL